MRHDPVPPADLLPLLRSLEAKTAIACERGRETARVGPFFATVHRTSDVPWLSCAIPLTDRGAEPVTAGVIEQLRALFRARGRLLRFEFFEPLWPELGAELEKHGLKRDSAMPLMICGREDLRPVRAAGVAVHPLRETEDDSVLRQFLTTAKAAFGEAERLGAGVTQAEVIDLRDSLQAGASRSAWATLGGQLAGVGSMTTANDELVGIGTLPAFRRRGVAATVSTHLVADHFRRGAPLAWLSAGDEAAYATYAKIGFRPAGVQLNYIDEAENGSATPTTPPVPF